MRSYENKGTSLPLQNGGKKESESDHKEH
jgi:hypothetical protein